ncbi:MAG: hypothetical protein ABFD60_13615 [Bryobacteraceae bacterium]
MSVQIFLQGKILGTQDFLLSAAPGAKPGTLAENERLLVGRARYITLLSEVLPRALLAELGLSKILLGSSGGGQFLVVLPAEARPNAEEFLSAAAREIRELSGGNLRLVTAVTENLGDWSVVRKRLNEEMRARRGSPAAGLSPDAFTPFQEQPEADGTRYFIESLGAELRGADVVGWSPETPGRILLGPGKHSWSLTAGQSLDAIPFARHTATSENETQPADGLTLGRRAHGRPLWGVLRGDVDHLGVRLRRLHTIEEHVQISVMYKQFFAGEIELLCSLPEFWRKVGILYTGGDDFAVYGSWDALISLAREIQRLFHRFSEENLKDFPGQEGKTITMAIALAPEPEAALASVYAEAGRKLELAKSSDRDCVHVFGRTIEWRQLAAAADLRDTIVRMAEELDSPEQFLAELAGLYRKTSTVEDESSGGELRFRKPWRVYRRLNLAVGEPRVREIQKLRNQLTNEMLAKSFAQVKLRPGGRVALEWARLLTQRCNP